MSSNKSNKRKHDQMDLESKESGDGTVEEQVTASSSADDLLPDIQMSIQQLTVADKFFEIPEQFTSDADLEKLLSNIISLPSLSDDNVDNDAPTKKLLIRRREKTVEALSKLKDWSNYPAKEQRLVFKASFLKLSGPIRFLLFIEVQMRDAKLVSLAVDVINKCTNDYEGSNEYGKHVKTTLDVLCHSNCLRTLQLAVEEFERPSSIDEWEVIQSLWWFISKIHRISEIDHDDFSSFMESNLKCFIEGTIPQSFIKEAVQALMSFQLILHNVGRQLDTQLCTKYGKTLRSIREFFQKHSSELISFSFGVFSMLHVLKWFVNDDVLCEEEIIGWVSFIIEVMPTGPNIEQQGLDTLFHIVNENNVDRAKLVSQTTLTTFISQILQEKTLEDSLQTKYRDLMVKLMTY